jgi:quinol monooxygenase YgiN
MPQAAAYAQTARQQAGCLFCELTASLDDPDVVVLVEGFADAEAHAAHIHSAHEAAIIARLDRRRRQI